MKKVCIISPMFLPVPAVLGGAIENLITVLIKQNEIQKEYSFTVYTIANPNMKDDYQYTTIKQIKLNPFLTFFQRIINKIFNIFKLEKYYDFHSFLYKKIAFMLKKEDCDFILVENNMILYKTIYNKDKKFIFHLHNDLNSFDKTIEDYKFIEKTSYKILVVSNFLKKRLNLVKPSNKIEVFENVLDKEKYLNHQKDISLIYTLQQKYNIINHKVIGYVGRIEKEKGLLELIKAFNEAKLENTKLLLVCEDFLNFKYKKGHILKLQKEVEKNKENIVITGKIPYEEILNYYDLIDILVIPTIVEEAFGMVALEGLALKKRMIYTESGALPDILNNKVFVKVPLKDNLVLNLKKALESEIKKDILIDIPLKINGYEEYYKKFKEVTE